jgi:transketolase
MDKTTEQTNMTNTSTEQAPPTRDWKSEYQSRIERGLAKGLSRKEARGHGPLLETDEIKAAKQQLQEAQERAREAQQRARAVTQRVRDAKQRFADALLVAKAVVETPEQWEELANALEAIAAKFGSATAEPSHSQPHTQQLSPSQYH